jgi:general secretion pathway protein L
VVPVQALAWHRVGLPKGIAPARRGCAPRSRACWKTSCWTTRGLALRVQPPGAPASRLGGRLRPAWLRSALQRWKPPSRPSPASSPNSRPKASRAVRHRRPEQPLLVAEQRAACWPAAGPRPLPLLPACREAPRLAEPAVAGLAEQLLQRKFALQQAPQRWLQSARTRWDLAQFDFASSGRARRSRSWRTGWADLLRAPHWRPARWGAVLLVAPTWSA